MEFGTRYKTIEEVVTILEHGLGIAMKKTDDGETGISYDWYADVNEFGMSYHGIDVLPTRIFNYEERRTQLRNRHWGKYSFVIGVSDELESHISQIRELIAQGVLQAEEIPEPR